MSSIVLGRVSTTVFLVAALLLVLVATVWPQSMHIGSVHLVDWLGLVIYVGAPVAWLSAMYHWVRYFPEDGPRRRWGVVVVLGFVPGAIAYWFRGVQHADKG